MNATEIAEELEESEPIVNGQSETIPPPTTAYVPDAGIPVGRPVATPRKKSAPRQQRYAPVPVTVINQPPAAASPTPPAEIREPRGKFGLHAMNQWWAMCSRFKVFYRDLTTGNIVLVPVLYTRQDLDQFSDADEFLIKVVSTKWPSDYYAIEIVTFDGRISPRSEHKLGAPAQGQTQMMGMGSMQTTMPMPFAGHGFMPPGMNGSPTPPPPITEPKEDPRVAMLERKLEEMRYEGKMAEDRRRYEDQIRRLEDERKSERSAWEREMKEIKRELREPPPIDPEKLTSTIVEKVLSLQGNKKSTTDELEVLTRAIKNLAPEKDAIGQFQAFIGIMEAAKRISGGGLGNLLGPGGINGLMQGLGSSNASRQMTPAHNDRPETVAHNDRPQLPPSQEGYPPAVEEAIKRMAAADDDVKRIDSTLALFDSFLKVPALQPEHATMVDLIRKQDRDGLLKHVQRVLTILVAEDRFGLDQAHFIKLAFMSDKLGNYVVGELTKRAM